MKIQSIQNPNINYKKPVFKKWERTVFNDSKSFNFEDILHRNNTIFFRNPSFWQNAVKFFEKEYKNVQKVNVYCYGCSDGSEAYTFAMTLLTKIGKKAKKYFPIQAKDYDPVAIEKIQENKYELSNEEQEYIKKNTSNQFKRFLTTLKEKPDRSKYIYAKVKKNLQDRVDFSLANILEDYKSIEKENSIVFARNFWPYLGDIKSLEKQEVLLRNLYKTMGKNSYLIIGDFDTDATNGRIKSVLYKTGFIKTEIPKIYKRRDENDIIKTSIIREISEFFQYITN